VQISVVGTGLLGSAIVERFLDLAIEVTVYNRTKEKTDPLLRRGATIARSAAEAIQAAPCTILMLSDARAIQEVVFASGGRLNLQQKTIIQMGTIAPAESFRFGQEVQTRLGAYLEAPVLGSIAEARSGKLIVMVGGSEELFERWNPILQCLGPEPIRVGPLGQAAVLKLALNQLIASHITAFSLSLGMIQRSGGDVDIFMRVLRQSALMTPMFDKKLHKMLDHDYSNPNFPIEHLLKDVTLCLKTAKGAHLEIGTLQSMQTLFKKAVAQSLPNQDYSTVFESIVPRKDT